MPPRRTTSCPLAPIVVQVRRVFDRARYSCSDLTDEPCRPRCRFPSPDLPVRNKFNCASSGACCATSSCPSPRRTSHVENDLPCDLSVAHLEDVDQSHFHFAADRKMPISIFGHLKSNRAVVHHTILGSDALEWLKGHIAHGRPELPIIILDRLLPRERSVKTVRCRCLPNDIVGECRKCGLHVVQRLTVKMVHNGRQILSYSFFVHILLSMSWHNS